MNAKEEITKACKELEEMLHKKNDSYGNSALKPIRVFSKADTEEQLLVRLDDKLNRIMNNQENAMGESTIDDILGYLVLLKVLRKRNKDDVEG
jgi:hypothetical protein